MRRLNLITTLITSTMLTPPAVAEGVHFNGSSYPLHPGLYLDVNPTVPTSSGMCSYWYSAPTTAKTQATVIASYPQYSINSSTTGILIEHYPVGSNMELHALIQLAGVVNSQLDYYFTTPLHYWSTTETPADKTSVLVYWDSSSGNMIAQVNGNIAPIDTTRSSTTGVPFSIITNDPTNKVAWSVGAKLIQGGTVSQFFKGDLNQVYCHFDDNDYNYITSPRAITPTSGREFPIYFKLNPANGQLTGPFPQNMGPNCLDVMPTSYNFPTLCMRGNPTGFISNAGAGTPFLVEPANGILTDATYTPFDLIPLTNP